MSGLLLGATVVSLCVLVCVCMCRVGSGIEHPPLVEWPEGISFMKSDNIQATPSSLFYKSSLTLINEVEAEREREREDGRKKLRAVLGDEGVMEEGEIEREREGETPTPWPACSQDQ